MESEVHGATLGGPARWLLLALAGLCVVLAVIGIFVPVLPTVPFLLLAAWAASRSSPRLHRWLLNHRHFGRPLREWEAHGVVPRPAKWAATVMMTISGGVLAMIAPRPWLPAVAVGALAMAALLWWLWKRPERAPVG